MLRFSILRYSDVVLTNYRLDGSCISINSTISPYLVDSVVVYRSAQPWYCTMAVPSFHKMTRLLSLLHLKGISFSTWLSCRATCWGTSPKYLAELQASSIIPSLSCPEKAYPRGCCRFKQSTNRYKYGVCFDSRSNSLGNFSFNIYCSFIKRGPPFPLHRYQVNLFTLF